MTADILNKSKEWLECRRGNLKAALKDKLLTSTVEAELRLISAAISYQATGDMTFSKYNSMHDTQLSLPSGVI